MNNITGTLSTDQISKLNNLPKTTNMKKSLDKDAFLLLLTKQLEMQDPLNPMSDKDSIAQMAQFSSLEQMQSLVKESVKSTEGMQEISEKLDNLNKNILDLIKISKEQNVKSEEVNVKLLNELINLNKNIYK